MNDFENLDYSEIVLEVIESPKFFNNRRICETTPLEIDLVIQEIVLGEHGSVERIDLDDSDLMVINVIEVLKSRWI